METAVVKFTLNKENDENAAGQPNGQATDIDQRIQLMSWDVSESDDEVVAKKRNPFGSGLLRVHPETGQYTVRYTTGAIWKKQRISDVSFKTLLNRFRGHLAPKARGLQSGREMGLKVCAVWPKLSSPARSDRGPDSSNRGPHQDPGCGLWHWPGTRPYL